MKTLFTLGALLFCITITAQTTYVPDDNFEAYLEANGMGNGSPNDNFVTTANINTVTSLDISAQNIADLTGIEDFIALTFLNCFNNQLTSLDISNNTAITQFSCTNNQLTSLNVKNGNNFNFTNFFAQNNPNLFCINVDNAAWSTANWTIIDPASSFSEDCINTYVPDDNFEAYLEANGMGNGIPNDNFVTTANINTITSLNVNSQNIADLTGIERFSSLTWLRCDDNQLTSLDITNNIALTTLEIRRNQLTSLDVTQNTALRALIFGGNNLTSLDVTQNTSLQNLSCSLNNLTSLDVTQNTALFSLNCENNQLTSLDVTQNTALFSLTCHSNNLASLDVTQNTSLRSLFCGFNNLTSLDVSINTDLTALFCEDNQLTSLDVKNGNNNNFFSFRTRNNPNLTCINVDDAAWSTANWTDIDPASSFNENCFEFLNTYVPDDNFEAYLEANGMGNGIANDDYVTTTNINTVTNLNITSKNIADLTGIEDFTALSVLICNQNLLTSLDLSQNMALTLLICGDNQLTSLDVKNGNNTNIVFFEARVNPNLICINVDNAAYSSGNWTLIDPTSSFSEDCFNFLNTYVPDDNFEAYLEANGMGNGIANDDYVTTANINTVTSLFLVNQNIADFTGIEDFTALEQLQSTNNPITSLDLSQNTNFILLICGLNNLLTSINVKNGNNTNVVFFDARGNPNLSCINVDDAAYSTANWTQIDPPTAFSENCGIKIWESAAWNFGPPTLSDDAIIRDDYNTNIQGANIEANTLTIDSGFTVTIADGGFLNIFGNITVNGALDVAHQGSVVQVDNNAATINNGSITVRKTTPFLQTKDFMIMGSPMTGETREGVYGMGRLVLRHITSNFDPHPDIAAASPGAENFADATGNDWTLQTGLLNSGEGYFVRPQPDRVTSGTFDLDYTLGTLNSGTIAYNVEFNGTQIGSPNILGNPYASAIDTDAFMAVNSMIDVVYFWEHLTAPSPSYPGFLSNNFDMGDISSYSAGSGGLPAANGGATPGQFMSSGQGFAIKASAAGTAVFTNAMRVTGPNDSYRNTETTTPERDRIWLNITNDSYGLGSNILVAFVDGASNNFENYYDTKRLATPVSMYSILDDKSELGIQGREAFDIEQEITLGFTTQIAETQSYMISIRDLEGIHLEAATVYLQDKVLNTFTNLSEESYSFIANEGIQDNRFVLLFKEKTLAIEDQLDILSTIGVYPVPSKTSITITNPQSLALTTATIYDLTGRLIQTIDLSEMGTETTIDISRFDAGMYILAIESKDRKIIKRIIKE